ncbi:MAG TPA: hypothetical protein DCS07_01900 [Bdellovibrionales bacterium]|nr:MAG: hypothetical protein A2Z97_07950 [Bdellovibrionales bacterium GWB1_52_6]OFZ05129.1 MAG: hypothetical protein A2X97_09250 [Bdellovibrionales bacterium GWA1_52_35]OFZ34914.1 MAG: hypothetical protein A2070_02570 [Bdellovibrionales bacterium GWC1_52_8]HAR41378.1 hypothetical protein [Bdellovibrionales bacterium]HCM38879.1 hypothetical protein [Bdellovibrionales bacterium]
MKKKYLAISLESTEGFFKEALMLAKRAEAEDEVPVGAVIVQSEKIVGRGYNRREQDQDPLAHAEIMAILEAARSLGSWRLEGCTVFVTLEPCPMCLAALQQARVERVVFGTKDPKGGALSLGYKFNDDSRMHHRFAVEEIGYPPGARILKEFFARKRAEKRAGSSTPR